MECYVDFHCATHMSSMTNPMISNSSLIHVWPLDRKTLENNSHIRRFGRWNFQFISKPGRSTNKLKIPTAKSSNVRIIFQRFSVQQSNMYKGWIWNHWIGHRAHVGGAAEVNLTFRLVEKFVIICYSFMVHSFHEALRATFHETLTLTLTQGGP